ncbi:MAG: AraC family transcriptional regulator [Deltaproteobacteria bacterium]|nr:AraC family transcriptional regulator [Deltaproteobacteria bacterium]
MPKALATLATTVIDAAKSLGLDADELIVRAGVDRADLDVLDGRIEVDTLMRLWEVVAEASGDPAFGLHAGERFVSAKTIHVVGYAARNCETLGDCYERTSRFGKLTNEGSEISLRVEGDRAFMRTNPVAGRPPWPRCYAEMALAAYLALGRDWTNERFPVLGVTFQHVAPGDISEYVRIFGPNVRFGALKNELELPASALALPLREPDPSLRDYLEARAAVLLSSLEEGHELENLVRTKIDEELANGTPSVAAVAKRLAMSARTLQRRLGEENLSFTELVDDVRKKTALGLIENPRFSVFEIAALVGYRDAESFRAAFQRWTGASPRDYRRRTSPHEPAPRSRRG